MLIWKTSSLNINIASVRYRCLLPLHYLELHGYQSCIYADNNEIQCQGKSDIVIFVKSFSPHDLCLAKQLHQASVPVILDICDNIFIEDYIFQDINVTPQQIFKEMSKLASAIVTTGEPLKNVIEAEVGTSTPVFIIPDGNETLEDVKRSFDFIKWERWVKLGIYNPKLFLQIIINNVKYRIASYAKKTYNYLRKRFSSNYFKIYFWRKKIAKLNGQFRRMVKKILRIETSNQELNYPENNLLLNNLSPVPSYCEILQESNQLISKSEQQSEASLALTKNVALTEEIPKIIWFGNHGANYGNFGMLNILDIADHLIKISQEIKFKLLVVSNNYEKYCQHILPLPFPTEYVKWDPLNIYKYISQSNLTIIPNSKTPFSICKSANRAVLSLSLGVPVIATKTPALDIFNECIICDEWERGLKAYLTDQQLVNTHVETAKSIIKSNYSGEAIANQWANVLNQVSGNVV
ncbi:glycosyltransferase [Calothrix sp. PCC 7507]|uniref:glycosyltransferase n=1 Tax=Calothrix sp. PCC 7507 TaxID=99598 RepID=UPI00029ED516|nr:glycosyltransferase [Calothrix sp. PCC 7507]AFY35621.1 hypothetical protein Cal7507_5282 [Calothrix sp. PCC 7507]